MVSWFPRRAPCHRGWGFALVLFGSRATWAESGKRVIAKHHGTPVKEQIDLRWYFSKMSWRRGKRRKPYETLSLRQAMHHNMIGINHDGGNFEHPELPQAGRNSISVSRNNFDVRN